jgi:hypothetical protein
MKLSLDEAHGIVAGGRAYTKEHFPLGSPGKYVGHVAADTYDAAVDRLVDGVVELVAENVMLRRALLAAGPTLRAVGDSTVKKLCKEALGEDWRL